MTTPDPFAAIAQRIAPGATLLRQWALEGGVSAQVDALELALPDGRTERVVVRRHGAVDTAHNPAIASDEFRLLGALHNAGLPVPAPRLVTGASDPFPDSCLVVDFVDGSTDLAREVLAGALASMADFLARLHALDLDTLALPALPRRDDPVPDILRCLPNCSLGERIRTALDAHGPVSSANQPVLLHGDFWPGNILWRDGEIAAVIDWEDAAIGDPLADLAGARLELYWLAGDDAMTAFTEHYRSMTMINLAHLPFWELFAALGRLATMHRWGLDATTERDTRDRVDAFTERALQTL